MIYIQTLNGLQPVSTALTASNITKALGYTPARELHEMAGQKSLANYDLNIKAINHRGYSAGAPENTLPAYVLSKKNGFTYVECDVAFTSDNVAVLLHDNTIDRTSNGSGNINSMTYAKASMYDYGSWFNEANPDVKADYSGVKIPTFTQFIILCKHLGLHPYIELKPSGNYSQSQITQIVDEVKLCGMNGKVTYISFNNTFLQYVKAADPSARLGYLASTVNDTAITNCENLKTDTNEVFMDAKLASLTVNQIKKCLNKNIPVEVWTVNTEVEIKNMHQYISGVTSDNLIAGEVLYNAAMDLYDLEEVFIPTTAITLDSSTLSFSTMDTKQLIATVIPADATSPVVWTTDDATVATVSSSGLVTPIRNGNCIITAISDTVKAECAVNVAVATYSITRNLIGCTSSSSRDSIVAGGVIDESINPVLGYSLQNAVVSITQNGVDITNSAYSNGNITISNVVGDIVISIECKEVPTYTITRNLINCSGNNSQNAISEGETFYETYTPNVGYTLRGVQAVITMGDVDMSHCFVDGVINISNVVGNIVITLLAQECDDDAIIDLDLTNITDDVISNRGLGGSAYNAKLNKVTSADKYESTQTGVKLYNHQYATVPYGFSETQPFTIIIGGKFNSFSTKQYQRLFRTDSDAPSVYYNYGNSKQGYKMAGVANDDYVIYDDGLTNNVGKGVLNTLYHKTADGIDNTKNHVYIWTNDGTIISLYIDGVLKATQPTAGLTTSTSFGIGDTDSSKSYYAAEIEINCVKVYDYVLSSDDIATYKPLSIPATDIALDKHILTFEDTASMQLNAVVTPSDTTDSIVWTSSNEEVARVVDGTVIPAGNGECDIVVSAGECSDTCAVIVNVANTVQPVVDLNFNTLEGNIIKNNGASTYDTSLHTVTDDDSYFVENNELHLLKHAYTNTPYAFSANVPFTITVKGRYVDNGTNRYGRLVRTENDAPSLYWTKQSDTYGTKLAGVTQNGNVVVDKNLIRTWQNTNNSAIIESTKVIMSDTNEYTWTNDGTTISLYINGKLAATQNADKLTSSSYIGLGDNNPDTEYCANEIAISKFAIYDQCLTATQVEFLI